MKIFWLGFLAAIFVLPLGVATYFRLGFADVQSDAPPSAWESKIMSVAVRQAIVRRATQQPPADLENEERLVEGGKLYVNGCTGCHGGLGKPPGKDWSHFPPVPQLPASGTHYTAAQSYWIVKHGIRMTAMSAYGPFYSEQQLWGIAAFLQNIRSLPPGVQERILAKPASPPAAN